MTFLEAINWLTEMGYDKAILEADCLDMIEGILANCIANIELGAINRSCKHSFVRRKPNYIVHPLAKAAQFIINETN
ncbi:hypothetical protein JHK82_050933 [Glycine max]|uniref:RNase H type-1 domain-containing protein n=1 Tax=Glycine max TaxID=3847 RepID=A0A0R0FDG8_SOYBN|nr:hypothetical protein JHK86_050790 [Glycine max]KAG4936712.1 hypothetical protein JHK85_051631 [Glycine max]KAG5092155.1 hypothetical protein JHK82_050933 [Glycine max]KAG5095238.1 hypothetical protein JHK84_050826 [Glycine max]